MRKTIIVMAMLIAVSLMAVSCGDPAATNSAANKPANAANNATATTTAPANHDADVKKLMTDLAAALAKNDSDAAAKFYAEDYHLITAQGVDQTKAARLEDMKSGNTKFESFAYENVSVRSYGDTAIAISDVKAKGKVSGQDLASNMKATLVLHRTKDGWKVVSGQATPVTAASTAPKPANTNTAAATNTNAAAPANK